MLVLVGLARNDAGSGYVEVPPTTKRMPNWCCGKAIHLDHPTTLRNSAQNRP
jgi:hypothetical protein